MNQVATVVMIFRSHFFVLRCSYFYFLIYLFIFRLSCHTHNYCCNFALTCNSVSLRSHVPSWAKKRILSDHQLRTSNQNLDNWLPQTSQARYQIVIILCSFKNEATLDWQCSFDSASYIYIYIHTG